MSLDHSVAEDRNAQTARQSDDKTQSGPEWLPWLPRLSRALEVIESFLGQRIMGIIIGIALLCVAAIYVTPAYHLVNNGQAYGDMSVDPFTMDKSPFRHRILSSVIAYYLHLRGPYFLYFPLVVSVIFMGAIYSHFRRLGHSQVSGLIASCTMAFSGPVLFLLHFQGYTDILSHLFLFWCLVLRRSRFLWVILLALSCLNHEATLFSLPWVVLFRTLSYSSPLLSLRGTLRFALDVGLAALSTVPMFLLQELWPLQNEALAPGFYLSLLKNMWTITFRFSGLGIFEAFKLFWFIPLLTILTLERGKRCLTLLVLSLMYAAGVGQLFFSHDISRHVHHSFPLILFSLELALNRFKASIRLQEVLLILIFCNFFVPQYYIGQQSAWPFLSAPFSYALRLLGFDPWQLHFTPWN